MKNLFITLSLVFINSLSFAAPLNDYLGTYLFNSDSLKVVQTQHTLSIAMRNDAARKLAQNLVAKGYQCLLGAGSINKCRKFDRSISEDTDLRNGVVIEFSNQPLNFEISNSSYELVNDAPAVKEYEKNQNSSFATTLFNRLHVYILSDGLTKLKLYSTSHADQSYFYINEQGQMAKQVKAVKVNQKQNVNIIDDRVIYLYEAVWKQ